MPVKNTNKKIKKSEKRTEVEEHLAGEDENKKTEKKLKTHSG